MATKLRMFAVTHESVTVAVDSDKKMQTAQEPIGLPDSLPYPLRKNKYLDQPLFRSFFRKTGDVSNVFQSTLMLVILLHRCFVEEVKKIYRLTCT